MNVNRSTTHRTVVVAATVLVSATGLVACGSQQDPASPRTVTSGLNQMEHEAHRQLAQVRAEQALALNPREHLAHQGVDEGTSAPSVKVSSTVKPGEHLARKGASSATLSSSPADCSVALAKAWQRLGHYSDGYERYLITQSPCA